MRSSAFSSSKSYTSKCKLKDNAVCPIKQKAIKISNGRSGKSSKHNCFDSMLCCQEQINIMSFITLQDGELITNQSALDFLAATSKDLEIQFVACLGSRTFGHQVICDYLQVNKQVLIGGTYLTIKQDCQQERKGIFIYNFAIKKKNKMLYFIGINFTNEQDAKLLHLITILSSSLTIFVSQYQKKSLFIQQIVGKFQEIIKNIPLCYILCSDTLTLDKSVLEDLESTFDQVILSSIRLDPNCPKRRQKTKLYIQSLQEAQLSKQKSKFFRARYLIHLIQDSFNEVKSFKSEGKAKVSNPELGIPLLVKRAYDQRLAETNSKYQEYFNQLDLQLIESQDQLIEELSRQSDKIVSEFNAQILDSNYHHLYLQQLLALIQDFEGKIIRSAQQNIQEKIQYSMEDTGQAEEAEVEDHSSLLLALEETQARHKGTCSKIIHTETIHKIFILARNAARMGVLGCDEKARIAQLREAIDRKWQQLNEIHAEQSRKKEEATEVNLLRQKHEMMEEKCSNLSMRTVFLSQQIRNCKNMVIYQGNKSTQRQKQLQQLSKVNQKNQSLIQFLANTSLQHPTIASLNNKIELLAQQNKELTLKKQLILQSLHQASPT